LLIKNAAVDNIKGKHILPVEIGKAFFWGILCGLKDCDLDEG